MTWDTTMVKIVRYLVDDICSEVYSDTRLKEMIVISARLLFSSISFDNTYTISVVSPSISPDPVTIGDDGFVSLVSLKAACFIMGGEVKAAAANSISVTDGPSSINMKGAFDALKERQEQMCKDYDKALAQYQLGNARGCRAIISSYVQEVGWYNPLDIRG